MFNKIRIKDKLVKRIILSYIVLLIVPFLFVLALYGVSYKMLSKELVSNNDYFANRTMSLLENELNEIKQFSMNVEKNQGLMDLASSYKPNSEFYMEAPTIISDIRSYSLTTNFSDSYYIYMKNNDYYITTDSLYQSKLFEDFFCTKEKHEYLDFETIPKNTFFRDEYNNISFVYPLKKNFYSREYGYLVVNFRVENLDVLVEEANLHGGFLYIFDEENNLIYEHSEKEYNNGDITNNLESSNYSSNIEGEEYFITKVMSTENNFSYYIGIPYKNVFSNLLFYQKLYIFVMFVILLITIFIAFILARRSSKPIQNLANNMRKFTQFSDVQDSVKIINAGMNNLLKENKELNKDIEKNKPFVESAYLNRILRGLVFDKNELDAIFNHFNISLENKVFYCVYFEIKSEISKLGFDKDTIEILSTCRTIVNNIIMNSKRDFDILPYNTSTNGLIGIFIFSKDNVLNKEDLNKYLIDIYNSIDPYDFGLSITISNKFENILNAWRSFEEVKETMDFLLNNYSKKADNKIYWYEDMEISENSIYYPVEIERQLIDFVKNGDEEHALELLNIIYTKNIKEITLNETMTKYLISNLKGTVVRIITIMKITNDNFNVKRIGFQFTIEENFETIKLFLSNICKLVKNEKHEAEDDFIKEVKGFINENIENPDLGLTYISSKYKISEAYFSYKFKEFTGINFAKYIENIRIEKAVDLLQTTNENINDIALMVGYNSPQSFRRAFKKVMGNSPSSYRNK